ncbi:siroheme decarboxylase subunit beta [Alcaligenes sp. SDU_A2]|uniref:siroheme decarboxylase subunit beta n=1 Tax=Alcaligenes sp. SDU_A2 TaxID=3136634 RepID=UPI002C642438|nr:Lrp/AsnC family transcriptional regulator [Alcaligenes sp.]HRL28129.1 Lrp/AsnC family transcriptional regulator [Alcaligenes sp.]
MATSPLDPADAALIHATQDGLPLEPRPYHALALHLKMAPADVLERMNAMLAKGLIRRIAAVPNHYALGYLANGMCVWNIDDHQIDQAGILLGALPQVSHCYRRPRHLPLWPYNLFTMLHGTHRAAVLKQADDIAELLQSKLPGALKSRDVLFSSAILKKTGLRIRSN